ATPGPDPAAPAAVQPEAPPRAREPATAEPDVPPAAPPPVASEPGTADDVPATPQHSRPSGGGGPLRILAILVILGGLILMVAGAFTWYVVRDQLSDEKITVSDDADRFAGQDVERPFHRLRAGPGDQQARPRGQRRPDLRRARPGRPAARHGHDRVVPASLALHLGGVVRGGLLRLRHGHPDDPGRVGAALGQQAAAH